MQKILVVEDEDDIRNNLLRLLRIEGYAVEAANNGLRGLELARQTQPSLILSDVMMPELDGFGLIEALRRDPQTQQIPVILLTARADRSDIRQGMNLGADDYLTKPFQRDELLAAITSRLERAAAQREATERLAREARRLMHYDPTTGLPNRALFQTLLETATTAAERLGGKIAVLRIAIGKLDLIEQQHGHRGQESALQEIGRRLEATITGALCANRLDAVGVLGDGQFAILLNEFADDSYAMEIGEALLDNLTQPLPLAGSETFILGSIGSCIFPRDGERAEHLLLHAEAALSAAQLDGGGKLVAFSAEMTADTSERLRLHNDLHRALERRELEVYYQPQLDSRLVPVGFEALIRWKHPELGFVSPVKFIPVAEENRQIIPIGTWVLATACRQVRAWRDAGHTAIRVAVNLSARQFADPTLLQVVADTLRDTGLGADGLELEITEGTAMQNAAHTAAVLQGFKDMGITVAIDDFGTGYSSLSYLKRFPLDILKIDQSFVRNINTDRDDRAIASAVASLAHSLGLKVVAEGVETEEHRAVLSELAVEYYQGYLFGKPMPAHEADTWLAARCP
jgi:diguanylate cyclase (GGDEF)-like protein